ncbi:hypothetical protein [Amycolatopsis sp. NPDC059021]|uniref:hypothetical protein n=1 Tax=Amycolatopsis sp. NPDC059021 TaxID=3346704 RepID=UPI00366A867B
MKPIICKVCSRRLNHYADEFGVAYAHPLDVDTNHEPEPIEAPKGWRGKCDFCSHDEPVSVLPVDDFRLPKMSNHQSLGDWAACGMCAVLVETGRWDSLVKRVAAKAAQQRGVPVDLIVAFTLTTLFDAVRKHTRGRLRPLAEENER